MKTTLLSALALAATLFAGAASADAVPIEAQFNVVGLGALAADTPAVVNATTISSGEPNSVGFVQTSNIGLVTGTPVTLSPQPMGVTVGSVFTKTFQTPEGTFVETLTVTARREVRNALGIRAEGTIVQTVQNGANPFAPTPVFWSAAYTQNQGPGTQINGSYNNSTTPLPPPPPPGPDDDAKAVPLSGLPVLVLAVGLVGLLASRRRKA